AETGGGLASHPIVAEHLNTLSCKWPETLPERGRAVISTAKAICDKIGRGKPPYSAVSKFIWFAHPGNWTFYDSLATAGMLPDGGTSEQRIDAYYRALDGQLSPLCDRLRPLCDRSE